MSPSSNTRRRYLPVVLAVGATLIVAVGLAGPAIGFNPQPEPPAHTVPFTVRTDEILQVHAVNLGDDTCHVTINISDATGEPRLTAETRLAPGAVATRAMRSPGSEVFWSWYTWRPVSEGGRCHVSTSAELIGPDGGTTLVVPGRRVEFDPQSNRTADPGR